MLSSSLQRVLLPRGEESRRVECEWAWGEESVGKDWVLGSETGMYVGRSVWRRVIGVLTDL